MSGAELTVAEQARLREEEDQARKQWMQRIRAKQIFNEAAAQMEGKGGALKVPAEYPACFGKLVDRLSIDEKHLTWGQ